VDAFRIRQTGTGEPTKKAARVCGPARLLRRHRSG